MEAHDHECNPQRSSTLTKLPVELLYLIVARLDTPSVLSLRSTCCLASHWVNPTFCNLLKSRKYFLHPYSFNLLEELSVSPFAKCVERIVIGTETFLPAFHLTADEYGRTLTSAFQRFAHLRAVEIRDFVPTSVMDYYYDDDVVIDHRERVFSIAEFIRQCLSYQDPYEEQYNFRWGEEEDQLHSQGFQHVSVGYPKRAFQKPPDIVHRGALRYRCPRPTAQLAELFCATLQACAVAKTTGVNVTDFRLALTHQWGIPDHHMTGFTGGQRSEMGQFLSSLEVLHLTTCNPGGIGPRTNIHPFLSACTGLKWLRLEFQSGRLMELEAKNLLTCFSEMGERSQLNRLDLGGVHMNGWILTSLILRSRPKILSIWVAINRESHFNNRQDLNEYRNWGWGPFLREVAGVVEQVRIAHAAQTCGRRRKLVRLVDEGREPLTLPRVGHGYMSLSPDNVEAVLRNMVFGDWRRGWRRE